MSASLSDARIQPDFGDVLLRDFVYHVLADIGRHVERRHVDRPRHIEHRRVGLESLDVTARAD